MWTYQRCIDVLEGLVVAQMFELTKMNRSQTGMTLTFATATTDSNVIGYNLCKHTTNTLKARSVTICTALNRHNAAALSLVPPRQVLDWNQIVEYAFLSDFDLLRDARQDIRRKPWATPAARLAIDQAFKLECADEEIVQLNIEVPQLATYIRDEDICLHDKEAELLLSHPALALQVGLHRMERGHFNAHHLKVLGKIYLLPGYTGPIRFGTHVAEASTTTEEDTTEEPQTALPPTGTTPSHEEDLEEDLDEEQAGEDEEIEVLGAFFSVLDMSVDVPHSQEE